MANLTDAQKVVVVACETKNNGEPTYINSPVDAQGWNRVTWLILVGEINTTLDAKIEESATGAFGGEETDIPGAALSQLGAGDDGSEAAIEIPMSSSRKRYQRPVITVGDGAPGAALAAVAILSGFKSSAKDAATADLEQQVVVG